MRQDKRRNLSKCKPIESNIYRIMKCVSSVLRIVQMSFFFLFESVCCASFSSRCFTSVVSLPLSPTAVNNQCHHNSMLITFSSLNRISSYMRFPSGASLLTLRQGLGGPTQLEQKSFSEVNFKPLNFLPARCLRRGLGLSETQGLMRGKQSEHFKGLGIKLGKLLRTQQQFEMMLKERPFLIILKLIPFASQE